MSMAFRHHLMPLIAALPLPYRHRIVVLFVIVVVRRAWWLGGAANDCNNDDNLSHTSTDHVRRQPRLSAVACVGGEGLRKGETVRKEDRQCVCVKGLRTDLFVAVCWFYLRSDATYREIEFVENTNSGKRSLLVCLPIITIIIIIDHSQMCGGYANISGGDSVEALSVLTGWPCEKFKLKGS